MLGDLIYEEKGTTTGVRVLESENGSVKLEVSIQTEGKILGVGRAVGDGVEYRGSIYFHTSAEKYSHLTTIAGVHEYDVDGAGNIANKIWEWK